MKKIGKSKKKQEKREKTKRKRKRQRKQKEIFNKQLLGDVAKLSLLHFVASEMS